MGVDNSGTDPFEIFTEVTHVRETDAEAGAGGPTLTAWGFGRFDRLTTLIAGTYDNNSQFTFAGGVVDALARRFDRSLTDGNNELFHARETDAEAGAGGPIMAAWLADRVTRLTSLVVGTFSNESSFAIEAAVIDVAARRFDRSFTDENNEVFHGTNISGRFLDSDQTPLAGTVSLLDNSDVVREEAISGSFRLAENPPPGVTAGPDTPGTPSFDLEFEPTGAGFTFRTEGLGGVVNIGDIGYGTIRGVVTDVDGNIVAGDEVRGIGPVETISDFTDPSGVFELRGPDAQDVTIQGLKRSTSIDRTFSEFVETPNDLQYAGIDVAVQIPGGIAPEDVPIDIDVTGERARTDANGRVRFLRSPINTELTVTAWERVSETIVTGIQGAITDVLIEAGVGVRGTARSARTGEPVRNVDVILTIGEARARGRSRGNGVFEIGHPESGDLTLTVSEADWRYIRTDLDEAVAEGTTVDIDANLIEATNTGNT